MPDIHPPESNATEISSSLPAEGYVRLKQLIGPHGPLPISKSTLWEYVRTGRFPAPVKLGPRTTAWSVRAVREYLSRLQPEA